MNMKSMDILLVEDNETDAELTIRALKTTEAVNNIVHLIDGPEALDYLFAKGNYSNRSAHDHPSIILLDLKLPKLNGLEVLKTIKQDPGTKSIPVIMMTSSKETPDIEQAYALGANSYIVKPVEYDKFTHAVRTIGYYWMFINQSPLDR